MSYLAFFLGGIILHSLFFDLNIEMTTLFSLMVLGAGLLFLRKKIFIVLLILVFLLGLWRFHLSLPGSESRSLDYFADEGIEIQLEGLVVSDSQQTDLAKRFVFESEFVLIGGERVSLKTKILTSSSLAVDVRYADRFLLTGVVQKPSSFEGKGGRIFDYKRYLMKDGVHYTMRNGHLSQLDQSDLSWGRSLVSFLYSLKRKLISSINKRLPQPHSGLLAGVLFGEVAALPDSVDEDFRRVGLTHIVVLSGYNVSLVIQLFLNVLNFLPLRVRSLLAFGGIVAFALLVGAGPTVVRASVMATFLVFANLIGRAYHVVRALIAAGIVMLLIDPWLLLFDLSFQLSFLATLSLILFSPILERYFSRIPNVLEFRSSLVATLSAQLGVTPLILYSIGDFSLISPVVNSIALFAVPWAMLFGFLLSLAPSAWFVVPILSTLSYLSLHYILLVVKFFGDLSFALVTIPKFHIILVFVSYLLLVLWYVRESRTRS